MAEGTFEFEFVGPKTAVSKCISGTKANILSCKILVNWTGGDIWFYVSNRGTLTSPPAENHWEEVTLVSGQEKVHTFAGVGQCLYWKIVKDDTAVIAPIYTVTGERLYPAIRIREITTQ